MNTAHIKVPAELFALAESSRFEGQFDKETLRTACDEYQFIGPISWSVDVTNTGEALLVAGHATACARVECARCLKPFEVDFDGEVEGYYLIDGAEAHLDEASDGEFEMLDESHVIDLEPLIMAGLIMDAPTVPLCADDCKGLCPVCGADLNEGACGCDVSAQDDAFEEAKNPFAALKNFDFGE